MSKLLQLRGGTTSEHSSFTGAVREVTVDTTKDTLVVHDGSTAGGHALLKEGDVTNANFTGADLEIGKGGTGASTAGAARTALGLAIGSDVQAHDADTAKLDAAANFTGTLQRSGTNVLVAGDVTNANFTGADLEIGKGGTGSSTASAARTALGLAIGSDIETFNANKYPSPTVTGTNVTATNASYHIASAGGITITLPASPSAGNYVIVKDGTGAAATTTFTVARNGSNIASSGTDLVFDKNFAQIVMTYVNSTIGWSI